MSFIFLNNQFTVKSKLFFPVSMTELAVFITDKDKKIQSLDGLLKLSNRKN
jgi:hypothetical protein